MLHKFDLTKKTILSRVSEKEIFEFYLEHSDVNLVDLYTNPLRNDTEPGCSYFIRNSDGRLIFNDFAWRQFDCFDVVMILHRVSYHKSLQIVYNDMIEKLPRDKRVIDANLIHLKQQKRALKLEISRRKFKSYELDFWSMNGKLFVTEEELKDNKIFAIDCFSENGVRRMNCKMIFAYHWWGYNYQIYNPNHKENERKFINPSGIKYGDLEYCNNKANYIVITKSKKCSFYLRKFGVNTFFIINERILLSKEFMHSLSHLTIFTLFDNDWTGKTQSIKYKWEYNTIPIILPQNEEKTLPKDFTEYVDANDVDYIVDVINEMKSIYNLID